MALKNCFNHPLYNMGGRHFGCCLCLSDLAITKVRSVTGSHWHFSLALGGGAILETSVRDYA